LTKYNAEVIITMADAAKYTIMYYKDRRGKEPEQEDAIEK
jgi:hypothetical protein